MIINTYIKTERLLCHLSTHSGLMSEYPVEQLSISMREKIVLPLVTIQQFAIANIRELEKNFVQNNLKSTYEKLAMRCSFGIINAGRNSA